MKIIGLTGASGGGKSWVSTLLKEKGACIVDADAIAHEVMLPGGAAYAEVLELFGSGILGPDGLIDRKTLGAIVFSDEEKRRKHVEITHKHIIEEMLRQTEEAKSEGYWLVVMDAPLLVEANLHKVVDSVWVVYAPEQMRLTRIMQRDGLEKGDVLRRFAAQMPYETLRCYADVVIENTGTLEGLKQRVEQLLIGMSDEFEG